MALWTDIGGLLLLSFGASLALAVALGRSSQRADDAFDDSPEVAEIAAGLAQLSELRSPSGRRFFPTLQARRELAEMVHEALGATH